MSRLFSDSQLREFARPDEERALEALRAGDLPGVRHWLKRMASGNAGLDALSMHALARKAGKLKQDMGEARAREALYRIGKAQMRTWIAQFQAGDERGAIADLVAVYKHQGDARTQALEETETHVIFDLVPCGSGGRVDRQRLAERHPAAYGDWSDGVNSLCQACKACQHALNDALGEPVWTTDKGDEGHCRLRFRKRASRGRQLFQPEERRTLVRTRVEQARERLDAGDTAIEPLLAGQRKDWMPWHDFGVVWLEHFYAVALELGGPDYLDEMLAQTYEPAFHAGFPHYAALTDEELVREVARTWNYHCADFTVHEEEDRFVFRLDPCGSGGRLFRGQMWRDMFRYGEDLAPLIPEPHNINFNRHNAPAYCTHCAASNRAQLKDGPAGDSPRFFVIDGHAQLAPGQPCRQFSYKKAASRAAMDPDIPAQIGLQEWRGDGG
ncbi:MAG: hypothetical protein JJT90_17610 [Ectothiorhodospiraceae bacterium]|nr:hypothetical protein [Ectothiorhodospiraceae bacterium]